MFLTFRRRFRHSPLPQYQHRVSQKNKDFIRSLRKCFPIICSYRHQICIKQWNYIVKPSAHASKGICGRKQEVLQGIMHQSKNIFLLHRRESRKNFLKHHNQNFHDEIGFLACRVVFYFSNSSNPLSVIATKLISTYHFWNSVTIC